MIDLTGKSVFVKTQEEYLSVLKMAKLQGFTWERGNNLNPIKIPFPNILNFYSNKMVTYRDNERTLYEASEIVEDEEKIKDAVNLVRTFTKCPDRTALTESFIDSLKLLADTVESQMKEVKQMERLTLDEAIKHEKEVAKTNLAEATYNFPDLKEYYDNCSECANQHNQLAEWLEELKSFKEAEEQGLLVRLPCKVGDKAWDNNFGYPESYEIKAFSYGYCDSYVEPDIEDQIIFYYENYSGSITGSFAMSEIGKTVFLTRE